jgi:hypothetical protein
VGSGHGKTGKSYASLREEVETYTEGPYFMALSAAQDLICSQKDSELLQRLFRIVIATSNSASEVPAWTLGEIFICQADLVESELRKLSRAEQLEIYKAISFGFEKVVYDWPRSDNRAVRLRAKLKSIEPKTAK